PRAGARSRRPGIFRGPGARRQPASQDAGRLAAAVPGPHHRRERPDRARDAAHRRIRTAAPPRRALPRGHRRGVEDGQALRLRTRPHLRQWRARPRRGAVARGRGPVAASLAAPAGTPCLDASPARRRDHAQVRDRAAVRFFPKQADRPAAMEFDLITRIRQRVATRDDVVLGIGDDAALLQPPPGMQLAVSMDTLNAGVHFPTATTPADIGWKALAVNLSDLAAMGAQPAWCTLSLSLPEADAGFVDGFLEGFLALSAQHGVAL